MLLLDSPLLRFLNRNVGLQVAFVEVADSCSVISGDCRFNDVSRLHLMIRSDSLLCHVEEKPFASLLCL